MCDMDKGGREREKKKEFTRYTLKQLSKKLRAAKRGGLQIFLSIQVSERNCQFFANLENKMLLMEVGKKTSDGGWQKRFQ